jgi:hypothetical protein
VSRDGVPGREFEYKKLKRRRIYFFRRLPLSLTAIAPAPHDNCHRVNPAYITPAPPFLATQQRPRPQLASPKSPAKIGATLIFNLAQKTFPAISTQSPAPKALKKFFPKF